MSASAAAKYELKNPVTHRAAELNVMPGTLGPDVLDISHLTRDLGVFTYDPGFMSTASTESKITYIDGDVGELLYRGYPVEQLAERSSYLEVADLLINGALPTKAKYKAFRDSISRHTMVNERLLRLFQGFHHDAHPMAMLSAVVASMAAFYYDTTDIHDPRHREIFAHRIIAKLPTIAAAAYKHSLGQPFVYPRNDLSYCANILNMFFAVPCEPYSIDLVAVEALDLLFILHADHEQNASTSTVRLAGSTGVNPYAAISAGVSALWGPAHGGANEAVLDMLDGIGSGAKIDKILQPVKEKKNNDPPAKIIRGMCYRVLEKLGKTNNPLFELSLKLEEIALKDEYFVSRKLYPNVDFYSGIIYSAPGIPRSMFTALFAIARTAGWVAHWLEMIADPAMRISRPRQLYTGATRRDYVPVALRSKH